MNTATESSTTTMAIPPVRVNVFPALKYRDAPAAIAWLVETLGFEERMVVPGPNGAIAHAQLGFGAGTVMIGSSRSDANDDTNGSGARADDRGVYIAVDEIDAHCARAKAAGADVGPGPQATDYGSREYSTRDPEGYIWTFGTYWPDETT